MADELTREEQIEAAWSQHLARPSYKRRGDLSADGRNRLAEAQGWRCCYCGVAMRVEQKRPDSATFEHVLPRVRGGDHSIENIVIACYACNQRRGDLPIRAFLRSCPANRGTG